ncbi:ABC transporter ATP-binding protein [Natrinema versiforme]|uniref:ABC transporter ATP-binding protein n=1 Tax=Natrinema versiforme TaxID=88724 RepID=A0A4P8WNE4_9EURY|nr:ABC transporter ATP-binding protein [Natrinema versiforme]QCS44984.1 ABC transporter ATP-binding protein [Natrinema versiforme]
MTIEIQNLSKQFEQPDGGQLEVLQDVDLVVEEESFTTIMGPSGCGKSTLLNILAGLVSRDSGTITRDGEPVNPASLSYAYIFQDPRLLKWRTVRQNISFALTAKGIPESEHDTRIEESLEMVGLLENKDSYPLQLSGGQRQRVGIARALAVDPDVLLMDEPFSALDELTARQLRRDVLDLWQETGKTVLFVTHNISEAVYLSDKILFIDNDGQIFNRATIDVERPREFEAPELVELETELMNQFFGHLEGSTEEESEELLEEME